VSIVGEEVTIIDSSDPTTTGKKGEVVLETANTLLLRTDGKTIRLPKAGTSLLRRGSSGVVGCEEFAGRLEDRLGGRKR